MADKVLPAGEDGRPLRYNEISSKSKVAICAYTIKPFAYNAFLRRIDGRHRGRWGRWESEETHGM